MSTGVVLAVAGMLWAAPALADETVTAGPVPNSFASSDVAIDQGEALLFQNSDATAFHDVTADADGSDGKALFASETIESGKSAPVEGVEFLTTGDYPFHCSVHPFMKATLHVSANGTPKPRTPANPAPTPSDTTAPDARVRILDSRIRTVLRRRGIAVRMLTDESARFRLRAKVGRTTVATGIVVVKGTKRDARLSLTRKGKKLLSRARKPVRLRLTARVNDSADNRAAASATRKLR